MDLSLLPSALSVHEDERRCLQLLKETTDLGRTLSEITWSPERPTDLTPWVPVLERFEKELQQCISEFPGLLATHHADRNLNLSEKESFVLGILGFLRKLLSWSMNKSIFKQHSYVESLIQARNEQILLSVLDVLLTVVGDGPPGKHRLISTRWFRLPVESIGIHRIDPQGRIQRLLTLIATYEGQVEPESSEPESDDDVDEMMDVQSIRSRLMTPVSAEQELMSLKEATQALDTLPDALLLVDGFRTLLAERRRLSRGFFIRTRVMIAALFSGTVTSISKSQLVRDAAFVIFNSPSARDLDMVAASSVLEMMCESSSKLVINTLTSRVPGRGMLVESVRRGLAEADADPETRFGLSFARVAEKKSSKEFWRRLEIQLSVCNVLSSYDPGMTALVDGGVVRAVVSWMRRALTEDEDTYEEDDGKFMALSAGACFLFLSAAASPAGLIRPNEEGETLIKGCMRLIQSLQRKTSTPSFPERTLLCSLIWAISGMAQASQRAATGVQTRIPPFLLTADECPLRDLFVALIADGTKFGAGVFRVTAEVLSEIVRGIPPEPVFRGPIGESIIRFVQNFELKCPYDDAEGVFAVPKFIWTVLRKSSYGRTELNLTRPFAKIFSILRDARFFPALAISGHELGATLRDFLRDTTELNSAFLEDLKDAVENLKKISDPEIRTLAIMYTFTCLSEVLQDGHVSRQFVDSSGISQTVGFILAENADRTLNRRTLDLMFSCIRGPMMACRKETLEAFCGYTEQLLASDLNGSGNETILAEWAIDILGTLLSGGQPNRYHSRGSFTSSETVVEALEALGNWDARQLHPTRAYSKFLGDVVRGNLRGGLQYMHSNSRSRSDPKFINHLVWTIQTMIDVDSQHDRSLARAYIVLCSHGGSHDDILQQLYVSKVTERLIPLCCSALVRPEMGTIGAKLLAVLCDENKMKDADWASAAGSREAGEATCTDAAMRIAMRTVDELLKVDFRKVSAGGLESFMDTLERLLDPGRSWRPPKKVVPPRAPVTESKPAFAPDAKIVHPLMDMGFHVAHIQDAQERLRSNDMQELTLYLLENQRPVTEEDELKLAVWLSMGEGVSDQSESKKEPDLSPEELSDKQRQDTEETNNKQLIDNLRNHVLDACIQVGSVRPSMQLPMEAIHAADVQSIELNRQVALPLSAVWSMVVFRNESEETFKVSSALGKKPSCIVVLPHSIVSFHSYVDSILIISKANDGHPVGAVTTRWAFVEVVIPTHFDFSMKRSMMMVHLLRPVHTSLSPKPEAAIDHPPIFFLNDTEKIVEISPVSAQEAFVHRGSAGFTSTSFTSIPLATAFILRPGESSVHPFRPDAVWQCTNALTGEPMGIFGPEKGGAQNNVQWVICVGAGRLERGPKRLFHRVAELILAVLEGSNQTDMVEKATKVLHDNPPVFAEVLQAVTGWAPEKRKKLQINSALSFEALVTHLISQSHPQVSHLKVNSKHPVSSKGAPTTSAKKRPADEAELLDEAAQEESIGGKKKRTSSPLSATMGDSPARAQLFLAIRWLLLVGEDEKVENLDKLFKNITDSLATFNPFETEAAFDLLQSHAGRFLTLSNVVEAIRTHGYLPSAARCLELLLRVPEDEIFAYRQTAYSHWRNWTLRKKAAASTSSSVSARPMKLSFDVYCNSLEIPKGENEKFSHAVDGFLQIDWSHSSSGEITGCKKPELDESSGSVLAEEFASLVETHFDASTTPTLLADLFTKLPRLVPAITRRESILRKLSELLLSEENVRKEAIQMCLVLRHCAKASDAAKDVIARNIVTAVGGAESSWTYWMIFVLLRSSPRLVLASLEKHIDEKTLQKLEPAKGSQSFSELLTLFEFLVSRQVRTLRAEGFAEEHEEIEDDDSALEEFVLNQLQRRWALDSGSSERQDGTASMESILDIEEMMLLYEGDRLGAAIGELPLGGGFHSSGMPHGRRGGIVMQNTIGTRLTRDGGEEEDDRGGRFLGVVDPLRRLGAPTDSRLPFSVQTEFRFLGRTPRGSEPEREGRRATASGRNTEGTRGPSREEQRRELRALLMQQSRPRQQPQDQPSEPVQQQAEQQGDVQMKTEETGEEEKTEQ